MDENPGMDADNAMDAGMPPGAALDRESIGELLAAAPPLVSGYLSLETQLQPNGFDLTLQSIVAISSRGQLGVDDSSRQLPRVTPLSFDGNGWVDLAAGPYRITFNEIVRLPLDLIALGRPRSSLARSGVSVHTGVWDAGYHGRSEALLLVHPGQGFRLQQHARVLQLVFFRLLQPVREGYQGRFQGEGV